jgi:hypothetical protein
MAAKPFKYNREKIIECITGIVKNTLSKEEAEEKAYKINATVNVLVDCEENLIKSIEKQENHPTLKELSYNLIGRNIGFFKEVYSYDHTWEEIEAAKEENENQKLMHNLQEAAFHAYMEIDFTDITEMLNYRKDKFSDIQCHATNGDKSLEQTYIIHEPGFYEVKEIQEYIYWVVQEALSRFRDELHSNIKDNNPIMGEYYNHQSGIFCRITKDGVEINYTPITGYGSADGRN